MKNLINAVGALIKARGRYHTEKNYADLVEAYDAAMLAAQRPLDEQVLARITEVLKHHSVLDGVLRADLAAAIAATKPTPHHADTERLDLLIRYCGSQSFTLIDQKWHFLNPRGRVAGVGTTPREAIDVAISTRTNGGA